MIWIVLGIALVVVAIAYASGSGRRQIERLEAQRRTDEENRQLRVTEAKRPEYFANLFREEFPDYADNISYASANNVIEAWNRARESADFKKMRADMNAKGKDTVVTEEANALFRFVATRAAKEVSQSFEAFADENPQTAFEGLSKILGASKKLALAK